MIRWWMGILCVAAVIGVALPNRGEAQNAPNDKKTDVNAQAKAFAERLDQIIEARLAKAKIKPGPMASDTQYLRRLFVDLAGHIPPLLEVRDYLDDDSPDKRERKIDLLLNGTINPKVAAGDLYAKNFANFWRHLMLTESNNFQFQNSAPTFESFLKQRLKSNTGYDKVVHEILTGNPNFQGGGGPNGMGGSSVSAFYLGNENKAENLAGATSRIFLGVKIECAQCHPHPFAKWSKNQFWEYAAFFSGLQQLFPQPGKAALPPDPFRKEIKIPDSDKVAKARFLDGTEPKWKDGEQTRTTLANWITSETNPYFAKAAVDHIWSYFFGVSLIEPILEPTDDSPPAHPELLDALAKEFVAQKFDLKYMMRAIVQTKAYQRVSVAISEKTKDELWLFAKMPVRGMSPEQFFDSIVEATEWDEPNTGPQFQQPGFGPQTPRREFLSKFSSQDKRNETQTSILQALFMMNGKFISERTKLENNKSLHTIATAPTTHAQRVETLYLLVLSRLPNEKETKRLVQYIENGGATADPQQAVADIYWALLNSGEFMLNH